MSDIWWGISFHMLICHMWIFFGEVCIMVFVSFLIWLFFFLIVEFKEFFIFGCALCRYFSQSVTYLSSLDIFFHRTEVFSFNEVQLINYFFHESCLWCFKKSFLHSRLSRCSCMLPPRSFIVLYLTFRSVIHFEFIFVKGVRSRFRFFFFFFCRRCQIVLIAFVEKLFFPNSVLCSFVKDQLTIFMGVYF